MVDPAGDVKPFRQYTHAVLEPSSSSSSSILFEIAVLRVAMKRPRVQRSNGLLVHERETAMARSNRSAIGRHVKEIASRTATARLSIAT